MKAKHLTIEMPKAFTIAILSAVLVSGLALASCENETFINGFIVPGNNIAEKLDWLQANAQNGESYTITINADESIPFAQKLEYKGRRNITIALRSSGGNRTINLTSNGYMFVIRAGITLILENITLRGRSFNTFPLIYVSSGATFRMNNGALITGNTAMEVNGGAVWVEGTFIMSGGAISGNASANNGGAVYVTTGNFTMNGGTISDNNSNKAGGGVAVNNRGTFIMSGGTITANNAKNGGGVAVLSGNFNMDNGAITANISEGDGGGVVVPGRATFTINNGTITANKANNGGGVAASNEGMVIFNNGSIAGNTALRGGGILVALNSTLTMSNGNISGNIGKTSGGGLYIAGVFTKTGGTITGYSSDRRNGNVISNNIGLAVSEKGHAVYAYFTSGKVAKRKENTAGANVNLSYSGKNGSYSGGWDY